ncbi:ATP-dependent nuclease [Streptococcus ruminantium]|uniref:AAA family ATPase n=2 Tax=Streptococcus ruminantium TaxID=1917441 RepID=A0ABU1B3B3_9STRE|nr:AAA family ATPase [Streptococcus ruminantium]MDQ8759322.1 AAA family ATPase [Streptococcus ruminantium]MDQ8768387.1 AAA family ATPase [Streptococcus ruminantium]MDQ8774842.1 AAA family ATPase [Streptococcus ruminantium]MDQ8793293.1 AAA family ATPase [Streptococcus ruminantium]MDQ8795885.1 AAA family ATPase [Streptococcus ruminantium]
MKKSTESPSVVIKEITFNNDNKIKFNKDDIILLVGANNVGKSRTLKDLREDLNNTSKSKVIIENVAYEAAGFSGDKLREYFERNIEKSSYGGYNVWIDDNDSHTFDEHSFTNISDEKNYFKALFSFLSTENRLGITKPINFNYKVDNQSLNIIQKLEKDSDSITNLNQALDLGFQKSVEVFEDYVDGHLIKQYKIGESQTIADAINSNSREKVNKLKPLEDLHNQGDGIRTAVAILSSIIVSEHSLFLIDEPETFLHPPQAKILGKNMVKLSFGKQLFISTHNIDFIRGVLEEDSARVKIIKIDRHDNNNAFNLVDNDSITKISNDKNLKYTNILNGLFYKQVVLCENESDCKFYSAILEHEDLTIYQNTLFCAVGGKEQFKKIVPLLKELNIEYQIIADIDLINNIDSLKQLLNSAIPNSYNEIAGQHKKFLENFQKETNSQVKTQEVIRAEINSLFNEDKYISSKTAEQMKSLLRDVNSLKLLKTGGKAVIPQGDCVRLFKQIVDFLKENNIYVLECGEIERFVPDVSGHGNNWVEKTFTKYEDISADVYDEARKFIRTVFIQ